MNNLLASAPCYLWEGAQRSQTRERLLVPRTGCWLLFASLSILAGCSPSDSPTAPQRGPALAIDATPRDFDFTPLAFLGDAAPGGGSFVNDFEPYGLNDGAVASFGADLTTGGEGVFFAREEEISEIARSGDPAPGGGTFGPAFLGKTPINDAGEVTFVFELAPETSPLGSNSGLYRFSPHHRGLTPVVVPGRTPAPRGGTFAGVFFDPSLNNEGEIAFGGLVPGPTSIPAPPVSTAATWDSASSERMRTATSPKW
jgi:hypothetical protein